MDTTSVVASLLDALLAACPRCAAGVAAREQVIEQGLTPNLIATIAPFAAIAVACCYIERLDTERRPQKRNS